RGVLPELGERAVATSTLEALLSKVLGGAPVEGRAERFERLSLAQPADRGRMKDEIALKSSAAFVRRLNRFARELPRRHIEFQDVCYGGQMIATRQLLRARLLAGDGPVGTRLRRIELALWRDIGQLRPARRRRLVEYAARRPEHALETEACGRAYSILECAALARHIRRFARLNVRALYGRLMADEGLNAPPPGKLPLEDAAAIACLRLLVEEGGSLPRIRQVVVDEAQDLDEVQFAVLNRLFPRARFTVLGDFNQSLDRPADRSMYDRIAAILGRRSAALVELNKSFRCTLEILRFALRFVGAPGGVECFNRSGDAPIERAGADLGALCTAIADEVALCRARGMQSIALIARTAKSAAAWRGRLTDLGLGLADGEAGVPSGAFLVPLALAKGLEFDAVLVLDAQQYAGDGRLLYVACTRALHRLSLYTLLEGGDAAWRS
ncbi:MAG: ATP-binding domain-containing protein, partial [Clostridiales bacterium]|nr:ATP-binding domain-containing protein [Clostridiales bacterium]